MLETLKLVWDEYNSIRHKFVIISRYINKEVFYTMIAITFIMVFIFLCNHFVRYLGYVVSGKYAANMLFHLLLLEIPNLFTLLLPLGLYLGLLLVLSRLYADSEITVLKAVGVNRQQLLGYAMKLTLLVAALVLFLVMWVNPFIARQRDIIIQKAQTSSVLQTIIPGRFQSVTGGSRIFYVKDISRNRKNMKDLFMADQTKDNNWVLISAKGGHQKIDKKTGDHFIVLTNGYRYEGVPGQKNFRTVKYSEYAMRIEATPLVSGYTSTAAMPISKLWTMINNSYAMAEIQWRIAAPLSVILLALIAIPLSRVKPRQGRFARFLPAILIYIFYVNMLFVSRNWIRMSSIPNWIGMWWIHIIVLFIAIGAFLYETY